jgi:HEAT repeat protein
MLLEPTQTVILLSILLLAAVLLCAAWVIGMHAANSYQVRRRDRLFASWRPLIMHYLAGEALDGELRRAASREPLLFSNLVLHQATLLSGSLVERLGMLVNESGLSRFVHRALRRPTGWRAAQAARIASLFRDADARPALIRMLSSTSPAIVFTAAHALARIGRPEDLPSVMQTLSEFSATNQDLVTLVLLAYGEACPDELLQFTDSGAMNDEPLYAILLSVLGTLRLYKASTLLRRELKQPRTDESLIKAIRALGELRAVDAADEIAALAPHDNWAVRGVAAWALGNLRSTTHIALLREMLQDAHWAVRLNAAAALTQMDDPGITALETSSRSAEDAYAADMARHVLQLRQLSVPVK